MSAVTDRRRALARPALAAAAVVVATLGACSREPGDLPPIDEGSGGAPPSPVGPTGGPSTGNGEPDPDDRDGDRFTPDEGDCNDKDPNVNPNAVEVLTATGEAPADEDCDGETDEPDEPCDDGLQIDSEGPNLAARALGICKKSRGPGDWGLVEARWVLAHGGDAPATGSEGELYALGHGLLDDFGPNVSPREGKRMLALSSGTARRPGDSGFVDPAGFAKNLPDGFPDGFPKSSPSCPGVLSGEPFDTAALELELRTPSNATGLAFDLNFYTYEWPRFICSAYNDVFLALLSPEPSGQADANISFDTEGNLISVNNALLEVCACPPDEPVPCSAGSKLFACSRGPDALVGTGFDDSAATGWLRTEAPVKARSIVELRLLVHDSGDPVLDSTVLLDNFRWLASAGVATSTVPIPD